MTSIEARTPTAAWLAASDYLLRQPNRRTSRIILEVSDPIGLTREDRADCELVDRFLTRHGGLPLTTVANTIFPWAIYRRHGAPAFYNEYLKAFPRIQKDHDARPWGTYFHRMIHRRDHKGEVINPLADTVTKLNKHLQNRAAYELGLIDPFIDIPTYAPEMDRHRPLGGPCLSHISFSISSERKLELTALYRAHFYVQRALGNLFGLAHLLHFVAQETHLEMGALTCVSNTALLETNGWKAREVDALIKSCQK